MKPQTGFFLFFAFCKIFAEEGYHYRVYLTPKPTGELEVEENYRFLDESKTTKGFLYLRLPKDLLQKSSFKRISLYENNLPLKPIKIIPKNPWEKAIYFEKLKGTNLSLRYVVENLLHFGKEKVSLKLYLRPFLAEEVLSAKIFILMDSVTKWQSTLGKIQVDNFKKRGGMAFQIWDIEENLGEYQLDIEFSIPPNWRQNRPLYKGLWEKNQYLLIIMILCLFFSLLWPIRYEKIFFISLGLIALFFFLRDCLWNILFYGQIFFLENTLENALLFIQNLFFCFLYSSFFVLILFFYGQAKRRHDMSTYLWAFASPFLLVSSLLIVEPKDLGQDRLIFASISLIFLLRPKTKKYFLFLENDFLKIINSLPVELGHLSQKLSLPKELILLKLKILVGYPFLLDYKNQKVNFLKKTAHKAKILCSECGYPNHRKKNSCSFCGKLIKPFFFPPLPSGPFVIGRWAEVSTWAFTIAFLTTGVVFVIILIYTNTKNYDLWKFSLIFPLGSLLAYYVGRRWSLSVGRGSWFRMSIFLFLLQMMLFYPLLLLVTMLKKSNQVYFGIIKNPKPSKKMVNLKELSQIWQISLWESHLLALYLSQKDFFYYDYHRAKAKFKKASS